MFNKIVAFVLAVMATVFTYANMAMAELVEDGLVSYWPLDRASIKDKTVKDVWGNNDGIIVEDLKIVEGKIHEALKFDGDNYVDCGDDSSLDCTNGVTIEAWAKPETAEGVGVGKYNCIVMKEECGPYQLYGTGGTWKFRIETAAGRAGEKDLQLDTKIAPEQWVHLAAVFDGKNMIIYTDGEEASKQDIGKVKIRPGGKVLIGAYRTAGDMVAFKGLIDNVRIYNRGLSKDEIKQNFADKGISVVNSTDKLAITWGKIKVAK